MSARLFASLCGLCLFTSVAIAQTDPLLEVHSPSLTAYKPTAATPINDVRPLAVLRGAALDGTLRAGSVQGMACAGNPFGSAPWGGASVGIRLGSGTHQIQDVDLALPAQVPWVIGRTFCAHQQDPGGSHRDGNGAQGKNWFQSSQPEIVFYDDASASASFDEHEVRVHHLPEEVTDFREHHTTE